MKALTTTQLDKWQHSHEQSVMQRLSKKIWVNRIALVFVEPIACLERSLEWLWSRSPIQMIGIGLLLPGSLIGFIGIAYAITLIAIPLLSLLSIGTLSMVIMAILKSHFRQR